MSVIEASFVRVAGTLADGTLRLVVDIEPRNAQAAFALFNSPGTPMALAALKAGAVPVEPEPTTPIGPFCKQAVIWCKDWEFQTWIHRHCGPPPGLTGEAMAKEMVLQECEVSSRKDLDESAQAQALWQSRIAGPYRKWRIARGLE